MQNVKKRISKRKIAKILLCVILIAGALLTYLYLYTDMLGSSINSLVSSLSFAHIHK